MPAPLVVAVVASVSSWRVVATDRREYSADQVGAACGSRLVVIGLKKIKAGPRAVTQLLDYRHTLDRQRRPLRPRTLAVLIADGITANAAQLAADHRITIIPLGHLGITVAKPSTR